MLRWSRQALTAVVLALLASGACTASGPPTERLPDILLVSIDTLRSDHMGLYGYARDTTPHIDRWFADGAVYTRSYSTEANTSPSVISMLTGELPQEHGIRLLMQLVPDDVPLVPDLLPDAYQTAAFVSNIVLTDEAIGIAERFDHYDDFVAEREPYRPVFERNASNTTDAVLAWLATRADAERPLFLWVHYIDPHGPYHPPDDWQRKFSHEGRVEIDIRKVPKYEREPGVTDGLAYVDSYDEEIAYMDAHVGRLLQSYAQRRSIDDTLVLLTADHGESMMEHERWFTHGYHVYEEITRVPMLVRGPGVEPGRRDTLVSGVDVVPTIFALLDRPAPEGTSGVDLRTGRGLGPERIVYTEATLRRGQKRAAIQGWRKWIASVDAEKGIHGHRVYDLREDPRELSPLSWDGEAEAARELVRLTAADPDEAGIPEKLLGGVRPKAPKVAPGVSDEMLQKLRALGYVE